MAATIKQIREWLDQFPPNWLVAVDEGGLTLVVQGKNKNTEYSYELGGEREKQDDEEE